MSTTDKFGEDISCSWCGQSCASGYYCPNCGTMNGARPGLMAARATGAWSGYSLNGCIFEAAPKPAPTLTVPKLNLPQSVDLRHFCSPVEDQLQTNSCVANAVVGALEFHQKKAGLAVTHMSRLFVYYNARSLSESEGDDTGSYIHHGMAAVLAYGACEAQIWPFDGDAVRTRPNKACYDNATRYEAIQYARTPRGEQALIALSQGLPVVFGMYAPGEYYQIAAQNGRMPRPDQVTPSQPPSGHAMLMVGYDLADQSYLVRNSWSARWADQGYCRIPFETMDAWSIEEDFWTIGAIEQTQGFGLQGVSLAQSMQAVGVPSGSYGIESNKLEDMRVGLRDKLSGDLEAAKKGFKDRLRGK